MTLAPCPLDFNLCRPEILEHAQMGSPAEFLLQQLGNLNATTHNDHVYILRVAFEKQVTNVAAHDIALHAKLVGAVAYLVENFLVQQACQFLIVV